MKVHLVFIADKCTALVGDVDRRGGHACWGRRTHGKSLDLLLNFEPKTALKTSLCLKKLIELGSSLYIIYLNFLKL